MGGAWRGGIGLAVVLGLVVSVGVAVLSPADGEGTVRIGVGRPAPQQPPGVLKSAVRPEGSSRLSGTVLLTALDAARTQVEITLPGGGDNSLPAHIHVGPCGSRDPRPRFGLANVRGGRSETVLPVPLQELVSRKFSVVVQATDSSRTGACGELVAG